MSLESVTKERRRLSKLDPVTAFDHMFEIVPASTPESLREAYKLRFQVYCVENQLEDAADNPDGLERDQYDCHSVHSLLVHRETESVSGAVRLILPKEDDLLDSFPIQRVCSAEALRASISTDLAHTAEISRFAASKRFRLRKGEIRYSDVNWVGAESITLNENRQLPYITLGLLRACLMMSIEHQISHVFTIMEPALIRLIRRFGLKFEPIGPLVSYHGQRQPCVARVEQLVEMAEMHRKDCWLVGTDRGRISFVGGT